MSETPVEESGDEERDVLAGDGGGSSSLGSIATGAADGLQRGAGGGVEWRKDELPRLPDGAERGKLQPRALLLPCVLLPSRARLLPLRRDAAQAMTTSKLARASLVRGSGRRRGRLGDGSVDSKPMGWFPAAICENSSSRLARSMSRDDHSDRRTIGIGAEAGLLHGKPGSRAEAVCPDGVAARWARLPLSVPIACLGPNAGARLQQSLPAGGA